MGISRMDENNIKKTYEDKVIFMHTVIVVITVVLPSILFMSGIVTVRQACALVGVGFFLLSGHACAFYKAYMYYLRHLEPLQGVDESVLKRMMRMSIVLDLSVAIFFYLMGVQK